MPDLVSLGQPPTAPPLASRVPRPRSPVEGAPRPGRAGALRYAAPALLAFAAVRLLGVLVLELWSTAPAKSAVVLLSGRWDSVWYSRIAEHGYGYTAVAADGSLHPDLAFFPLLPALERLLAAVLAVSPGHAGLLVSAVASLAAAWGVFAVGEHLHGRRTGVVLTVLWGAVPIGIVQSMAYTESLFTALAAWSLYAVLAGRWLAAGALALPAGLARPTGAALTAAVAAAALLLLVRQWRTAAPRARIAAGARTVAGAASAAPRRARILLAALLAPVGLFGYVAWVGVHEGHPLGYLAVQASWGNSFDGGLAFAFFAYDLLTGPAFPAGVALCTGLVLLAALCAGAVRQRQPLVLLVYCGAVVALALCGSGYFGSKPRLLLPAFPLLLPLAVALARARTAALAGVLGTAAAASAVYGAFWLHGTGPP